MHKKKIVIFVVVIVLLIGSIIFSKDKFFSKDINVTLKYGNNKPVANTTVTVRSSNGIWCEAFPCPTNTREYITNTNGSGKIVIPADIVQYEIVVIIDERRNLLAGFKTEDNKKDYILIF